MTVGFQGRVTRGKLGQPWDEAEIQGEKKSMIEEKQKHQQNKNQQQRVLSF